MNHQLENAVPHQAVVQGGGAAAPLKPRPGLREEKAGVSDTSGTVIGTLQKKNEKKKKHKEWVGTFIYVIQKHSDSTVSKLFSSCKSSFA